MAYSNRAVILILVILFASIFFETYESRIQKSVRSELIENFKRLFAPTSEKSFTTWFGNVITPQYIFRPNSLEDLQDIVKNAKTNGKKIRCAGRGHTWTSLSVTKDYLVIVNNLNKVVEITNTDKNGWTVTVLSGTQIKTIEHALLQNNPPLAFESMTVPNFFSASGVIAVGAHGCKTGGPSISDLVVKLQIVSEDGELQEFSNEKDPVEFSAAKLNLGLLGIIYSVTFRVEPLYNLRVNDIVIPIKTWLNPASIKKTLDTSDSLDIIYWPFNKGKIDLSNDDIWIKQFVRTQETPTMSQLDLDHLLQLFYNISRHSFDLLLKTPNLTPITKGFEWNDIVKETLVTNQVLIATDALHFLPDSELIVAEDSTFVVKADPDFTNIATAFSFTINKIGEYARKGKFPINISVAFRLLRASTALLSPAFDSDPNAVYSFFELTTYKNTPGWLDFQTEVSQELMSKYGARPHWAKEWESVPGIKQYLHKALGDRIATFEKVRAKYDPNNTFFDNDSLKQVFYG
ncbi:14461_t:CDS:2 [Ambispora leptoticha]|uniref:D-arabinono-1,4-lactone oxidase n=1 Tax=Ambispora leptoticha TaxID=144679 RepID=A0A9N9D594_9GLOM|nr:14461_t:CDS:2 [Ambispora leptoticha]